MTNEMKEMKIWISQRDKKYRYMLLDRMRQDCEYYLNGHECVNHLCGKTEEEQIDYMLFIWDLFTENEKPEWLSREQIIEFGKRMGVEVKENEYI
jgi:hypothetical protein